MGNKLWRMEPGWLGGYTEDRDLIRNIKRSKKDWSIMADYFIRGRLKGVQFKIPADKRRVAENAFGVTVEKSNK
ncbi:hypothetical protein GLW08_08155 [Pontibacillus yanchengensis]|uniref:Uncharacterized protein n=1 Tax=Pontibacillus yanchengensis TaxID=462910 RepID=A0ACC7VFD1_9BACI|nr:hypothetical protein [Pontibacillus yanchengensis]MYL53310.1 hypothetical protein [Pontibacillus yanchengensis]